jgi:hypothetical protein
MICVLYFMNLIVYGAVVLFTTFTGDKEKYDWGVLESFQKASVQQVIVLHFLLVKVSDEQLVNNKLSGEAQSSKYEQHGH